MNSSPEAFWRRFASEQPMPIAIEAGTHSPWASRVLEECGHEVLVANARKLRLICANKRKTDEVNAENLARLARVDPMLLYPLKHRSEEGRAHMALIRSRQALIGCLTQLVNHVRGAVKSFGAHPPKCLRPDKHRRRRPEHRAGWCCRSSAADAPPPAGAGPGAAPMQVEVRKGWGRRAEARPQTAGRPRLCVTRDACPPFRVRATSAR